MKDLDTAAFARPFSQDEELRVYDLAQTGLTKREYAAIHLRVPRSGDDELDAMIREAQRDALATRAMQGLLANPDVKDIVFVAPTAHTMAEAMMREREK